MERKELEGQIERGEREETDREECRRGSESERETRVDLFISPKKRFIPGFLLLDVSQ